MCRRRGGNRLDLTKAIGATTMTARAVRLILAAALAMTTLSEVAQAEMKKYFTSGYWTASAGTLNDGRLSCGMETSFGTASTFTKAIFFKWSAGDQHLFCAAVQAVVAGVSAGTRLDLDIGIDGNIVVGSVEAALGKPLVTERSDTGSYVEFIIGSDRYRDFMHEFREANRMWFKFPSGNEQPWVIERPARVTSPTAFTDCLTKVAASTQPHGGRPPATQPYAGAQPPAPTQPYNAKPVTREPVRGNSI